MHDKRLAVKKNISLREQRLQEALLREYIRDSLALESQLNEGLEFKEVIRDVLKVAAGAGAVALTGGMGGDTATDMLFAMDSAEEVISGIQSAADSAAELKDAIDAAMSTNISSGPEPVYSAVLGVATAAYQAGGEEVLENAKEQVDELLDKLANAIGEWVSTALPDDAGLGGIAVREAIESAIGAAGEDVYEMLKNSFNALPAEVQKFIADPAAFEQFMNMILDEIIEILKNYNESSETGEESGGVLATIASSATEMVKTAAVPGGIVMSAAMSKMLPKIIEFLDTTIREKIPEAAKILNTLVTVAFGSVALLQIVIREEYAPEDDQEATKEDEAAQKTAATAKETAQKANESVYLVRRLIRNELSKFPV